MKSHILLLFLVAVPVRAQQIPEGKPVGEIRLREFQGGHWVDLGTQSDWDRNHRQTTDTFTAPLPPVKTAEQIRKEQGELEKNQGIQALFAGDYTKAITLLSHARTSLPQDTTITDKLREARTALMNKLNAEADARRRTLIQSAITTATTSLETVFAAPPPSVSLTSVWGDPMVVDLSDASTLSVDPKSLKGLHIESNGPLPPPPTGLPAGPPEPNPNRTPKPTDAQMLAYFSGKKFDTLFFEYQLGRMQTPAPSLRFHEMIDESLKLLDTVPMRPIQVKSSAGMDELEAARPKVTKALESFKTRYHQLHLKATLRAIDDYSDVLDQLEADGWWKPGDDIEKAIAADPYLSRFVEAEAKKMNLRMLDYWDAAAETAYTELAAQMRAIMTSGDTPK
ncbi:MAG: hypothetical protein K9N55_18260 [Phycisphaerae bacterium]|nr:hypothetical protein [Phycisphaerae bacterium]